MFMVTYGRNDTFEVISYEDADFGVFADDIKSTLHFFFFFMLEPLYLGKVLNAQ